MTYLLEDLTVIDAATFLAAPGAATVLADYGANVIKIEPPGGDGYRKLVGSFPVGYHWLLTSRNKRSISVDLTQPRGQKLLHALVKHADVFLTNYNQRQLADFELQYPTLQEINPRLVYAQLTGFGTAGPDAQSRAFDTTAWWARSGLMEFIRDPGQTPLAAAPGMGDHASAMSLFGAIMAGLYRREKTGTGTRVSSSLLANGVWSNGMALQGVIAGNDIAAHRQKRGWHNPFNGIYQSKDGHYLVLAMINNQREWPQLAQALGHTEWLTDPRFSDMKTLMRNRMQLIDLINTATQQLTIEQLTAVLDLNDITYGRIQTMSEVIVDEQLLANDILIPTGDTKGDYDLTINSPIEILEEAKKPPARAPDPGAQSVEILLESGFAQVEIQSLLNDGIVHTAKDQSHD